MELTFAHWVYAIVTVSVIATMLLEEALSCRLSSELSLWQSFIKAA